MNIKHVNFEMIPKKWLPLYTFLLAEVFSNTLGRGMRQNCCNEIILIYCLAKFHIYIYIYTHTHTEEGENDKYTTKGVLNMKNFNKFLKAFLLYNISFSFIFYV